MTNTDTVTETVTVDAPAMVVYDAISDVRRMGEWSPECTGATLGDPARAPYVGMTFTGHNRAGRFRSWSTRCTVTAADPGHLFQFDVAVGQTVSTWTFELEQTPQGGTRLTQRWQDRRGSLRRRLAPLLSGVPDRAEHNRRTMRTTLDRLKAALEGAVEQ